MSHSPPAHGLGGDGEAVLAGLNAADAGHHECLFHSTYKDNVLRGDGLFALQLPISNRFLVMLQLPTMQPHFSGALVAYYATALGYSLLSQICFELLMVFADGAVLVWFFGLVVCFIGFCWGRGVKNSLS